jgi:hypothetical protein
MKFGANVLNFGFRDEDSDFDLKIGTNKSKFKCEFLNRGERFEIWIYK